MKAVKIVGGLVALLVIGLVIFVATFDVSQYKGLIQDQAKAATGREVKIGDIKMAISLNPAIVISDVSIANAPWGSRPQMAMAKTIEAQVQVIPLLSGSIRVSGLKVVDGDALLEVNSAGKGNWEFDVPPSSGEGPGLNVSGIDLERFKLGYRDAKTGMDADVSMNKAEVEIAGDLKNLEITAIDLDQGAVKYKDKTQSADIALGSLALRSKGPITGFGIQSIDVKDVTLAQKAGADSTNLKLTAISLGADGAIKLEGDLNGQPVKISGTMAPPADLIGAKKPMPAKVSIEGMGIKADADVVLDLTKQRPMAKGTVSIPELDLSAQAPAQPAAPAAASPDGKIFPADPLPWDLLSTADADLTLSIGRLKLPNGLELTDVKVPVKLNAGKLDANGLTATLIGGTVTADLGLVQSAKSLSAKVNAKGFTAENLLKQFGKSDLIGKGDVDLAVDVRGAGDNVRAIMAGLNGSVVGGMGESRIRNEALGFFGADVMMQLINVVNPFANKDPYMVAKCAVVNFQVTNGVANTNQGVVLVTDKMNVVSTGNINLGTERIDLSIRPQATTGLNMGLGNLTQSVKLAGPLSAPGVAIDKAGAVKAIGSLGAALATGGLSVLGQSAKAKVDAADQGDLCANARTWHLKQ